MRVTLIAAMLLAGGAVPVLVAAAEAREVLVAPRDAAPVCAKYAKAINTRRVVPPDTPLACDRGLWDDPEFGLGVERIAPPTDAARRLLIEAFAFQSSNDRADYIESRARSLASPGDAESPPRGYPLGLVAEFHPGFDLDNDGVADNVALVGNYGAPCGELRTTGQLETSVSLVFLTPDGALDLNRTLKLYEPGRWAEWTRLLSATAAGKRAHAGDLRWWDSFGVFRYDGQVYFDRLGVRHPETASAREFLAVFKATPDGVTQVCRLEVRPHE